MEIELRIEIGDTMLIAGTRYRVAEFHNEGAVCAWRLVELEEDADGRSSQN